MMSYQYKYNHNLIPYSHKNKKEQTDAEKLLWHHLRNRQLNSNKFKRQHPMQNYIIDFYCVEKKLAIEVDGSQHINNINYDENRTRELEKLDIRVIRFWDNDVLQNTEGVLEKILEALQ